jgi:ABC-type nickel/cobalt efflux system permease component RcnA/ABC-type uncharacterized transport system substrate-binding protein
LGQQVCKLIAVFSALLLLMTAHPAFAHPHIFVDARAALVFDDAGDLAAIRNQWTFDPAFSAWAIQGLDKNNDGAISEAELQPLADDYMKGLAVYNFYTSAGEAGRPDLTFHALPRPHIDYANQRITLRFVVAPDRPHRLQKTLQIGIDDPEYYVAIIFDGPSAVRLENAPPGCHAVLNPPKPMSYDLETRLAAIGADVVKLPPELEAAMRGVQGSIDLSCDYAITGPKQNPIAAPVTADNASTALDAVNAMGVSPTGIGGKPIPFGGPPRELGGFLPNSGVFLWILTQQQKFYELLTGTMGQLKANGAAFWMLGGLSFLYGIFHAAGPGHGKVVISSYVLANERQYRQGMLLSFASAMVGSAVAVLFILFAASVLRLTGTVMGNAAAWLDDGSYAMVSLLGLWLLIRQIFGLGHHHHEATGRGTQRHDDHADHRRAHRLLFEEEARAPAPSDSRDQARPDTGHAHHEAVPAPSLLARAFARSSRGHIAPGSAYAYAAATPGNPYGFDAAKDGEPGHAHAHPHRHDHDHHHGHDEPHSHVAVMPAQLRTGSWREAVGIVLAVGLRPCSGALIVMVFALSQGVLWAGIAAVFLMGVGTAITVATLATLAMFAKGLARRLSGRRQTVAMRLVWWAELGGALFVFVFGIVLILANLYG